MEKQHKFFSKKLLKEANEAAHREKRSKCINPSIIEKLPNDKFYFISRFLYHRKNELRVFIHLDFNKTKSFFLLDISVTRYLSLPYLLEDSENSFELNIPERPFKNSREWKEIEIKQPIRKQGNFRKLILEVYNNTCAVCNISEKSLLRAAHILDVKYGGEEVISNGICLCVNHEVAFDNNILNILPNYKIESKSEIGLTVKSLKLPLNEEFYPNPEFIILKNKLLNN